VNDENVAEPRLLSPEEKRAPRVVPWRLDRPQTYAGIAIIVVAVVFGVWCVRALTLTREIGWREDGIIVEVTRFELPRPGVKSVRVGRESYPWAYPPADGISGPCNGPKYRIDGMPERGRLYRDGDSLAVRLVYDAPGCVDMQVVFSGTFEPGSPRHDELCREPLAALPRSLCDEPVPGTIAASPITLHEPKGTVLAVAAPGVAPAVDPPSPPAGVTPYPSSIEGFKLCSVEVTVVGAVEVSPSGVRHLASRSSQRIYVDCEEAR
jgi:hypothetical protein